MTNKESLLQAFGLVLVAMSLSCYYLQIHNYGKNRLIKWFHWHILAIACGVGAVVVALLT